MAVSFARLYRSLPLRMAAPVLAVICLVGAGLYLFVLRSVSRFADEQIGSSLAGISSQIYNICDEGFTELMQTGRLDDRKANLIKKAVVLGAIEDYVLRNNIGCRLTENGEERLLLCRFSTDLLDHVKEHHSSGISATIPLGDAVYYFQHFDFKPWSWHVDLVKDAEAYEPLIRRVKRAYSITGLLLLVSLVLILALQERLLRRPLHRLIRALRENRPPRYAGIYELELLSDNISGMMRSLEEKNQWVHYLFRIAIAHRGGDFFKRVADVLAEALHAGVVILRVHRTGERFRPVAFSGPDGDEKARLGVCEGLPCEEIAARKKAVFLASEGSGSPPSPGAAARHPQGNYAGVPVFDREGAVTGIMHLFGGEKTFGEWDLRLIQTACRIVAVEFEYLANEKDKRRLEEELQRSKKMEAIGLIAGGVAHDLNNVLSGIVAYPDLLLMGLDADSPLRQPIRKIQRSGQKAAEIVQDLLTLARRGVANKAVLSLNDVIGDYLRSPEHEKLKKAHDNVVFDVRLDAQLLNVEGSPPQLSKLLMNLLSNAAEAQPTGGKVTVATGNRYVDTPIEGYERVEEGEYVLLRVEDRGIGIAAEDLPRIFEPFYTKKAMGRSGTGIGMAVVWGAVHDHDGYVDIESREGVGTAFSVYLPATRKKKAAVQGRIPVDEYMGNGETVLVVDDAKEQREIAANILGKLNYRVAAVPSGEAAVDYLERRRVDLLVLDMIMNPGIDGLETYRRVKRIHPAQKAIIASGYSESERVRAVQRLGAGEYIRKPYTLEKIGIAVKHELERDSHSR